MSRPSEAITGKPGMDGFAERLVCVREMRRMTQDRVAKATGLHPAAISHFETGHRIPCAANLRRLCIALNVSADYLLDSHADSKP